MASIGAPSAPSLPMSSPPPPSLSPPRKRLSKVLSAGRRRSSDVQSENGSSGLRGSLESLGLAKPPSVQSQRSLSREGSVRSNAGSSVKKLIPGHSKRERKRVREDELTKIVQEEATRGRQPAPAPAPVLAPAPAPAPAPATDASAGRGTGPDLGLVQRPDHLSRSHSSLVTEDSEIESPPPLTSRDSHIGYLTTTSPQITTTTTTATIDGQNQAAFKQNGSTEQFPSIVEPIQTPSLSPSPRSLPQHGLPAVLPFPGLVDKADTLKPHHDPNRSRSKSPGRRFKDVFSRAGKSPRVSPERRATDLVPPTIPLRAEGSLKHTSTGFGTSRLSNNPDARNPSPILKPTSSPISGLPTLPTLQTDVPVPRTPPGSILTGPATTVTPPTPVNTESKHDLPAAPILDSNTKELPSPPTNDAQNVNGHRRVRSQPGSLHQKSKLSTSMIAPLTPTIEEVRNPSPSIATGTPGSRNPGPGTGFFSSWMSAAQNAATSITNLTNQNRSRAGTGPSEISKARAVDTPLEEEKIAQDVEAQEMPKKELAINTLGSGDLNLAHLGIDASHEKRGTSASNAEYAAGLNGDLSANMEDVLAKRAVSQAYEKPSRSGEATPVAELADPVTHVRPASTFDTAGTLTPPNGSIFEGETTSVKRSNSVRSKLQNRRSRGSSVTTGQSTIGAIIGASTATLANPATGPKLSGFAIAPKQRNRAFHQLFRSVPEDDFLIEDYSCALQKEILLAGRIYISEGHICFSSNILGWVTTLIISFEEIVSIEKENTALVIPNAIAVQTLHARHTFRSLLSREATYDLMIGIWRVSHPDSFQKSMNSKKLAAGIVSTDNVTTGNEAEDPLTDDGSDDDSASDDDNSSSHSIASTGSLAGSEFVEPKSLSRKPSGGIANGPGPVVAASAAPAAGDATNSVAPIVTAADGVQDFPGPVAHAPTECNDSATHYDKIIKDEIIQAPLGKVFSLLYGAQSTTFVRKFLVDGVSKAQDLQLEDDKKGLDNETKSRKYQYIKPLGGSIGPKQTTCITTENLDFFDLEKAVSVTCTTQTPDVPSGSAFSTKTRYCLTWAQGNATRVQMNMTIEWTAKSWLKTPIEKGALDGQQQYGEDLIKTLKNALGRSRAATTGSKGLKGAKKRRKSPKKEKRHSIRLETKVEENWGPLEILRPMLDPLVSPVKPLMRMNVIVTVLGFMVLWMWFRGSGTSTAAVARSRHLERLAYYDDLWRREESDLWDWLQDRSGIDGTVMREAWHGDNLAVAENKQQLKQRQKLLKSKDMQTRLREEKKSMKEMEEAVRITQERLDSLHKALERQKSKT